MLVGEKSTGFGGDTTDREVDSEALFCDISFLIAMAPSGSGKARGLTGPGGRVDRRMRGERGWRWWREEPGVLRECRGSESWGGEGEMASKAEVDCLCKGNTSGLTTGMTSGWICASAGGEDVGVNRDLSPCSLGVDMRLLS